MNVKLGLTIASLLVCTFGEFHRIGILQTRLMAAPVHTEHSTPDVRTQKLMSVIQTEMNAQQVPGLALAIVENGKVVFQKGFGVSNMETNDPVTPQTLFRIGSTTKPLTVIALMRLVEAGQLDLDAPVVQYLPQFQVNSKITVRQLISHSAGLADAAEPYGRIDAAALKDSVAQLTPHSAFAPPGTVFSYANPGFRVAGAVLETITGESYASYMEKKVFPALGMTRTMFNPNLALTYPFAVGFHPTANGMDVFRPTPDHAAEAPAGLAFSTVQDMSQLLLLLLQDGQLQGKAVLSSKSVQAMKTPVLGNKLLQIEYGLGLEISQEEGVTTIGHGGAIPGYSATLETFPAHDLGIVILANRSGFDPTLILTTVRQAWLNLPKLADKPPIKLDEAALKAYVGNYRLTTATNPDVGTLTVSVGRGILKVQMAGQQAVELVPLRPDVFTLSAPGQPVMYVTFLRDKNGQVAFFAQGLRAFARSQL